MSHQFNGRGMALGGDTLREFCRAVGRKAVVIVNEAYFAT
jgi:histidinol-phosphate/aromatic aminotransferase/cobyric acid decarboxylase-like protein